MKNTVLLLLLLFSVFSRHVPAQGCLQDGIAFRTQKQIDDFPSNYPGCTHILGSIWIEGSTAGNIINLDSLSHIDSIGGDLKIKRNSNLKRLQSLATLTGYLSVRDNPKLTSLDGLNKLRSIGRYFSVTYNENLSSLSGLDKLRSIDGELVLSFNNTLTSLEGLENIDPSSMTNLLLEGSPNLSICEIKSICNYLTIPASTVSISGNAPGCNNRAEVEAVCERVVEVNTLTGVKVTIYPNPSTSIIHTTGMETGRITVIDTFGRRLIERTFDRSEINLSELPAGIYFIQIQSKNQRIAERVVKR